eukprot:scaffold71994_cov51-Attheya_sp.AAC.2
MGDLSHEKEGWLLAHNGWGLAFKIESRLYFTFYPIVIKHNHHHGSSIQQTSSRCIAADSSSTNGEIKEECRRHKQREAAIKRWDSKPSQSQNSKNYSTQSIDHTS